MASVSARRRPTEDNVGDLPLMGAVPQGQRAVNDVDLAKGQWILDLLKEAIDSAYQHKAAASDMGMDKSLLTRQLSGDGHLSLRRVGLLPDYVICSWAGRIQSRYGADDKAVRIERAMELIERGRTMLVAEAGK
jgi:AraC-like DNA-binding protein